MSYQFQCIEDKTFLVRSYRCKEKLLEAIPWERENVKVIGFVGPMGKRGCFSTFMVHLNFVGMGVSCCDPFGWLIVLHVLLGPTTLIVCGTLTTFGMMT